MINFSGHIDPTWDLADYHILSYNIATINEKYLGRYKSAGHNVEQIQILNYFEPNPMPDSVAYIKEQFNDLKLLSAAVNLMLPGQYLPHHRDLYERWMRVHNVTDINNIYRAIVMLDDAEIGQILQIDSTTISNWHAGDWFAWAGTTSHAIYNFSNRSRYAIQITGYMK
jgi:hypothetical protein